MAILTGINVGGGALVRVWGLGGHEFYGYETAPGECEAFPQAAILAGMRHDLFFPNECLGSSFLKINPSGRRRRQ